MIPGQETESPDSCIQFLQQRFGAEGPAQWLAAFQEHRWDLEEEAEALIRDGQEDAQGWIWLS
ncbi:hypothetical protein CKF66_23900 [Klebsiella pneumoniae]|nr:DUF1488 domain-containing protein [Klebsiella pneumoniae]RLJ11072.1 hypothetical protein CKF66_23900 [Klebsiella pneumoniae]